MRFVAALLMAGLVAACGNITRDIPLEPPIHEYVISGTSQETIHQLAAEWMAQNFRSANDVIQRDAPEDGVLIGRGHDQANQGLWEGAYDYTIRVDTSDGEMVVRFFNIQASETYDSTFYGEAFADDVDARLKQIADDMADYVRQGGIS